LKGGEDLFRGAGEGRRGKSLLVWFSLRAGERKRRERKTEQTGHYCLGGEGKNSFLLFSLFRRERREATPIPRISLFERRRNAYNPPPEANKEEKTPRDQRPYSKKKEGQRYLAPAKKNKILEVRKRGFRTQTAAGKRKDAI